MEKNQAILVRDATVRFNMASEKIDSLKEYAVKLLKRELMFQEFLALRRVDFSVQKGEAWGIVGCNGAGKSTLLKLICGILSPYRGQVEIQGSVAPLIELGAGFDANLTARENIFLNGALLGHSKKFMLSKYDEIVAFAELDGFMEMPVRNYSSGMRARLGFAIATLTRPHILICDEVLSVGDAKFQRKCLGRMKDMRAGGATLLFVSHSNSSVRSLCDRALWLEKGQVRMRGDADDVCDAYEKHMDIPCTRRRPVINAPPSGEPEARA